MSIGNSGKQDHFDDLNPLGEAAGGAPSPLTEPAAAALAKPSLLARMSAAGPYTVLLAVAAGAMGVAALCMVLEMVSYWLA